MCDQDQKILEGYLLSGNSGHDLCELFFDHLKEIGHYERFKNEFKVAWLEQEDNLPGCVESYLETYTQAVDEMNKPIIG